MPIRRLAKASRYNSKILEISRHRIVLLEEVKAYKLYASLDMLTDRIKRNNAGLPGNSTQGMCLVVTINIKNA